MKEHKFNSNVENIYNSLSDEEKEKYKKQQDKFNKSFLLVGIILILLFVATFGVLFYIIGKDYMEDIIVGIGLFLGVSLIIILIIKPCVVGLKSNDETNIKMCIERLEKAKEQLAKAREFELQKKCFI